MGDWRTYKTSELIRDGVLEIGDGYRAKNSEMSNTGLPFIRAGDVNGGVNTKGCDLLRFESVARVGNKRSRIGDVVLTTKGTVGRLGFVTASTDGFVYSPQLCFWRSLNPKFIEPRFIYFALQSKELKHQMGWSAGQTDMAPYISLTDQRTSFTISFPDIEEQRAIASILGALDDKIDLNRRMNETLESTTRLMFKDWFVDFGPVRAKAEGRQPPGLSPEIAALFPDALDDDDKPVGWENVTIGNLIDIFDSRRIPLSSREREKRKGPYPYHGAAGVMDYVDDFLFDGIYVLLGEDGSVVKEDGRPFTQYVWGKFWVNNHAHVIQGHGVCSEYILCFLEQLDISPYVTGAVQPKLNQGNLKSIPIIKPSTEVAEVFQKCIDPLYTKVRANVDESASLAQLRDFLLPKLMSGEIRLREAEKAVEQVA